MAKISKRLAGIVQSTHHKLISKHRIFPIKVPEGILVGNVLIVCDGSVKHLIQNDIILYQNIHLNSVAIQVANLIATNSPKISITKLIDADKEYSKWFQDSQLLKSRYHQAIDANQYQKSEILWARYIESREKTEVARKQVASLIN